MTLPPGGPPSSVSAVVPRRPRSCGLSPQRKGEGISPRTSLFAGERRRLCFDPLQGFAYIPLVHPEARDVEASMFSLAYQIVYNSSPEADSLAPASLLCLEAHPGLSCIEAKKPALGAHLLLSPGPGQDGPTWCHGRTGAWGSRQCDLRRVSC